jgi:hypothetical protein
MDKLKIPSVSLGMSSANPSNVKGIGFLILGIIILIVGIQYILKLGYKLATPANIHRIGNDQAVALTSKYTVQSSKRTVEGLWDKVPAEEQLLINTNFAGVRLGGYIGPFTDGVFDEVKGVMTALMTGARFMSLDISVDKESGNPVLMYRNARGYRVNLNNGSLAKVAKTLAENVFRGSSEGTPFNCEDSPFILFLSFQDLPDDGKKPASVIKYYGKVAKALQPLVPLLLAQTAQGDFRRQALESQICFQPWSVINRKIILLTNVDTSSMRQPDKYGVYAMNATEDLDLLVNGRVYRTEEGIQNFGLTVVPTSTVKPSFCLTTPGYFLNTPPDRKAEAILMTKSRMCIIMNESAEKPLANESIGSLLNDYGVNCIPYVHFADGVSDAWVGEGAPYEKTVMVAKAEGLRFSPPKQIALLEPSPKTNSLGGMVQAPKL